jgi:hypothetical protein
MRKSCPYCVDSQSADLTIWCRPNFIKGNVIGCAFTGSIVFMALAMHFLLDRENKRRDEQYGPVDADLEVDVTLEGDNHRNFRYLT